MLKAKEKGRVGLRSPNNQTEHKENEQNEFKLALTPLRLFLPGQGVISGLGDRGSRRACHLGSFRDRLKNLSLKILVMMTQKTRETKNRLRLTDQKQKRVWRVQGKGVMNQVFSNHNSALSSININASSKV